VKVSLRTAEQGIRAAFFLAVVASLAAAAPNSFAAYTPTNEWTALVGETINCTPAIGADGTVYFGTWRGKLWAISSKGEKKWFFSAGNEIKSSPALDRDGTLYFGSRDNRFYAVLPDGRKKWDFPTGGWVDSSPALAHDGTVYFGSWDRNVYALDADGRKKWQFQSGGPIDSSPAIGRDGTVYIGSHDQKLYALRPDGGKKWEFPAGGAIISSPAINRDGSICITSVDGWFYTLNSDGSLKWKLHTGGTVECSPVIGLNGMLYVGVENSFWAISPEGKQKWWRRVECRIDAPGVVLADGSICIVSRGGYMCGIDPENNLIWTLYLYGYGYGSPTIGPGGTLYTYDSSRGHLSSGLTAVTLGQPLARTPWPKFRCNLRNTGNALDAPGDASP
jgi:outer membrane protein assembly factor BamB